MNIALVLSGGMAKGAYQVGVLKAIRDIVDIKQIKYYSCASIGALNGYALYSDNIDSLEKAWLDLCNESDNIFITDVLKSNYIKDTIYSSNIIKNSAHDFFVVLYEKRWKYIIYQNLINQSEDNIRKILTASVSLPIYNKPVMIDGSYYYDGSMADNIPVMPLYNSDADLIICVYFDSRKYIFESVEFDKKILKIIFSPDSFVNESLYFSRSRIEYMIKRGYDMTYDTLNSFFDDGVLKCDFRQRLIRNQMSAYPANKRITGDVIVSQINKVSQRINKRVIKE